MKYSKKFVFKVVPPVIVMICIIGGFFVFVSSDKFTVATDNQSSSLILSSLQKIKLYFENKTKSVPQTQASATGYMSENLATYVCTKNVSSPKRHILGIAAFSIEDPITLQYISDLGVDWVRVEFRWDEIEPSKSAYQWAKFDKIVADLRSKNINILATIDHPPVWAHPIETLGTDYQNFLHNFVVRYKNDISYYEIFNEPNLPGYGWPFVTGDIDRDTKVYAAMVKISNRVIRNVQPDAFIISGGLSPSEDVYKFDAYVQALYANLPPACFDIFSMHPYGRADTLTQLQKDLRTYIGNLGDPGKTVWFGEFGTSENDTVYIQTLQKLGAQLKDLDGVIWFSLRDLKPTGWNFGLREYDWSEKPQYQLFKELVTKHKEYWANH